MTTYDITLTDPLRQGFVIAPGGFDGPGGAQSHSSLRLYGRGAVEWGEAVDEDLLRLAETFSGSTAPRSPISGQLWFQVQYYWHDSSLGDYAGWWRYDPAAKTWGKLNNTGIVAAVPDTVPAIGNYYFDNVKKILYRWDSAYKQEIAAWLDRSFTTSNLGGAAPSQSPTQSLLVYDAYTNNGQWIAPRTITVSTTQPTNPGKGYVWYNETNGTLWIWDGTKWVNILGPGDGSVPLAISSNLDMKNFSILNLADVTITATGQNAVNAKSVYAYVQSQVNSLGSIYLPLVGGTVTGNLTVNGTTTLATAVVGSGGLKMNSSAINMSGNKVVNLAAPTDSGDAVNKAYLDTTIANLGLSGLNSNNIARTNYTGTPHDGDIRTSAPNIVEIYSNGVWRRVFPAQWSA